MLEMGLNLENCERWLERAVFAALVVLFVIMVVRLHFLLAISNYYSHLTRHQRASSASASHAMQHISLLPKNNTNIRDLEHGVDSDLIYVPVSRHSLPKELQDQVTNAWVCNANTLSPSPLSDNRNHHPHCRHHRHHSGRSRFGSMSSQTGTIKLEISPDEGLLPVYAST